MAGKILEIKSQLQNSLHDETKPWARVLGKMENQTGVDRLYLFVGVIAATGTWLVFGYGAQLLCNLLGFLYPAYASMHALESKKKDDDTKWLTYWVVFAVFSIFEFFADIIAGWFPLYWLAKCIFLIWLMVPSDLNGSVILYRRIVRPYFLKHSEAIDETLSKVKDTADKLERDLRDKKDY